MQPEKLYSDPEICPKTPTPADMGKSWFINLRYWNREKGAWQQFPLKKGINKIKTFKERLAEAKALLEAVKEELKKGWNPITGEYEKIEEEEVDPLTAVNELSKMPFKKAADFALNKCEGTKRTKSDYRNTKNRIMKQAGRVKIPGYERTFDFRDIPIDALTKRHAIFLLDHCRSVYKWSNKAFNKNMGYFRAVIGKLKEVDIISHNPAAGIPELPVTETKKYIPYTEEEKRRIREYLYIHNYGLFAQLLVIYHTGLRPNEVLALQVRDVDLEKKLITVIPEEERDNSKTKNIRLVPISDTLFPTFREWLVGEHPPTNFIFGNSFGPGRGAKGPRGLQGAMHPNYFDVSPHRCRRDTVTRLWKKVVMETLKIDKHLYAAKHTGADDKIMAGIDLEALKEMYGHSSKYMTLEYVTKLKEIYRRQIRELSPDF